MFQMSKFSFQQVPAQLQDFQIYVQWSALPRSNIVKKKKKRWWHGAHIDGEQASLKRSLTLNPFGFFFFNPKWILDAGWL